ncbi:MAG TPA: GWxTD domain-containing protein [Gemmatimonadales bacterium]|nr:GWxTD domain-containing protein [Gemmatimonadales bacterium]
MRSFRPEEGRTEVNAFVQVPYSMMGPTVEGEGGALSYQVTVRVTDSTGLTLLQNAWQNHAPAEVRSPDASAVDMVHFSIAPGRYRLEVAVVDSVSGRRAASAVDLEGFAAAPPASDLLLSPQIRPATATDTVPRPAELRWGKMLVTAAARLELTPLRPTAYYLLEAYSGKEEKGTLSLRVTDSTGKVLVRTPATPVTVPQGGGVLKGQVDLAGLPGGTYTMTAALSLSQSVERSAMFTMANIGETLTRTVARREANKITDEGYFAAMAAAELDAAEEPLAVIARSGELRAYDKTLSANAKRRFLTDFWQRRDPTPGTPRNESRDAFYQAIVYANEHYREGGRTRPGWKSDRGRIFLKNGPPDETLQREQQALAPPYEVWRYRTGKDRWYCFVDRSRGVGLFQLIHSNDVNESGLPNWREILTPEALQDVGRFLGIDFFDRSREQ